MPPSRERGGAKPSNKQANPEPGKAGQDVLAEVKAPYLKYLKKRDKESWRLLVKLAQNKPCAATSYAVAKAHLQQAVWAVLAKSQANAAAAEDAALSHVMSAMEAATDGAEKHGSTHCLIFACSLGHTSSGREAGADQRWQLMSRLQSVTARLDHAVRDAEGSKERRAANAITAPATALATEEPAGSGTVGSGSGGGRPSSGKKARGKQLQAGKGEGAAAGAGAGAGGGAGGGSLPGQPWADPSLEVIPEDRREKIEWDGKMSALEYAGKAVETAKSCLGGWGQSEVPSPGAEQVLALQKALVSHADQGRVEEEKTLRKRLVLMAGKLLRKDDLEALITHLQMLPMLSEMTGTNLEAMEALGLEVKKSGKPKMVFLSEASKIESDQREDKRQAWLEKVKREREKKAAAEARERAATTFAYFERLLAQLPPNASKEEVAAKLNEAFRFKLGDINEMIELRRQQGEKGDEEAKADAAFLQRCWNSVLEAACAGALKLYVRFPDPERGTDDFFWKAAELPAGAGDLHVDSWLEQKAAANDDALRMQLKELQELVPSLGVIEKLEGVLLTSLPGRRGPQSQDWISAKQLSSALPDVRVGPAPGDAQWLRERGGLVPDSVDSRTASAFSSPAPAWHPPAPALSPAQLSMPTMAAALQSPASPKSLRGVVEGATMEARSLGGDAVSQPGEGSGAATSAEQGQQGVQSAKQLVAPEPAGPEDDSEGDSSQQAWAVPNGDAPGGSPPATPPRPDLLRVSTGNGALAHRSPLARDEAFCDMPEGASCPLATHLSSVAAYESAAAFWMPLDPIPEYPFRLPEEFQKSDALKAAYLEADFTLRPFMLGWALLRLGTRFLPSLEDLDRPGPALVPNAEDQAWLQRVNRSFFDAGASILDYAEAAEGPVGREAALQAVIRCFESDGLNELAALVTSDDGSGGGAVDTGPGSATAPAEGSSDQQQEQCGVAAGAAAGTETPPAGAAAAGDAETDPLAAITPDMYSHQLWAGTLFLEELFTCLGWAQLGATASSSNSGGGGGSSTQAPMRDGMTSGSAVEGSLGDSLSIHQGGSGASGTHSGQSSSPRAGSLAGAQQAQQQGAVAVQRADAGGAAAAAGEPAGEAHLAKEEVFYNARAFKDGGGEGGSAADTADVVVCKVKAHLIHTLGRGLGLLAHRRRLARLDLRAAGRFAALCAEGSSAPQLLEIVEWVPHKRDDVELGLLMGNLGQAPLPCVLRLLSYAALLASRAFMGAGDLLPNLHAFLIGLESKVELESLFSLPEELHSNGVGGGGQVPDHPGHPADTQGADAAKSVTRDGLGSTEGAAEDSVAGHAGRAGDSRDHSSQDPAGADAGACLGTDQGADGKAAEGAIAITGRTQEGAGSSSRRHIRVDRFEDLLEVVSALDRIGDSSDVKIDARSLLLSGDEQGEDGGLLREREAALLDKEVALTQQALAGALLTLQPSEGFKRPKDPEEERRLQALSLACWCHQMLDLSEEQGPAASSQPGRQAAAVMAKLGFDWSRVVVQGGDTSAQLDGQTNMLKQVQRGMAAMALAGRVASSAAHPMLRFHNLALTRDLERLEVYLQEGANEGDSSPLHPGGLHTALAPRRPGPFSGLPPRAPGEYAEALWNLRSVTALLDATRTALHLAAYKQGEEEYAQDVQANEELCRQKGIPKEEFKQRLKNLAEANRLLKSLRSIHKPVELEAQLKVALAVAGESLESFLEARHPWSEALGDVKALARGLARLPALQLSVQDRRGLLGAVAMLRAELASKQEGLTTALYNLGCLRDAIARQIQQHLSVVRESCVYNPLNVLVDRVLSHQLPIRWREDLEELQRNEQESAASAAREALIQQEVERERRRQEELQRKRAAERAAAEERQKALLARKASTDAAAADVDARAAAAEAAVLAGSSSEPSGDGQDQAGPDANGATSMEDAVARAAAERDQWPAEWRVWGATEHPPGGGSQADLLEGEGADNAAAEEEEQRTGRRGDSEGEWQATGASGRGAASRAQSSVGSAGAGSAGQQQGPLVPRVVGWRGEWVCRCGFRHGVKEGCSRCHHVPPCREHLMGICQRGRYCRYPHLRLDLPSAQPPPNLAPNDILVRLPGATAGDVRVVSWRGHWACRCGRKLPPAADCAGCGCKAPCSDWLQGECRGGACPRPHPPFSLDEDLPWEQVKHPTVVLWEGAPMYGTAGAAGSATQQAQQGSDSWRAGGWDRGRGPVGSDSVAAAASPRSLEAAGGASAETAAQSAGDFAAAEAGQYGPGGGDEEHVSMLQALGVQNGVVPLDGPQAAATSVSPSAAAGGGWRGMLLQRMLQELGPAAGTGLTNEAGEYNCFLNVIIQCLWHCVDFRAQVAAWPAVLYQTNPVVLALHGIFSALESEDSRKRAAKQAAQRPQSTLTTPPGAFVAAAAAAPPPMVPLGSPSVPSAPLLPPPMAPVGSPRPAAPSAQPPPVAHLGSPRGGAASDLAPAAAGAGAGEALATQQAQQEAQQGPQRSVVNPNPLREALSALPQGLFSVGEMADANEVLLALYDCIREATAAASAVGQPCDDLDAVFGLPVAEHVRCNSCGLVTHATRYTQYLYNTQATALRLARASQGAAASTGFLLHLLDHQTLMSCDTDKGGCNTRNPVEHTLERPPRVFTLQLAWESHREEAGDIAATLAAVDERIDLAAVYHHLEPKRHLYRLRSLVCYYGAHYFAFVLLPELGAWVMFDDTRVSRVGGWADVRRKCEAGRIQPSVLFYEAVQPLQQ